MTVLTPMNHQQMCLKLAHHHEMKIKEIKRAGFKVRTLFFPGHLKLEEASVRETLYSAYELWLVYRLFFF